MGLVKLLATLILSHTIYDLMRDDRQKWVGNIRRLVAKKWHEVEARINGGQKGA